MQVVLDEVPDDPLPAVRLRLTRLTVGIGKAGLQICGGPALQSGGDDFAGPPQAFDQLGGGTLGLIVIIPESENLQIFTALSQGVVKPAGAGANDVPGNESDCPQI